MQRYAAGCEVTFMGFVLLTNYIPIVEDDIN
jgi:hypothetical protein